MGLAAFEGAQCLVSQPEDEGGEGEPQIQCIGSAWHAEVQVECACVVPRVGGCESGGQGERGNKVGFCFHAGDRLRICRLLGKRVADRNFVNLGRLKQRDALG